MSCSAPDQNGVAVARDALAGPAVDDRTVIEGLVRSGGEPAAGAFVRLLDAGGEFTAEVVAGRDGQFRFYAAPGLWTVRALTPKARGARTVEVSAGRTRLDLDLGVLP